MLNLNDKSRLRGLIQSQEWQIVENLKKEYCERIIRNPKTRETDSETLKTVYREEGMVEGVSNFFQEIFNQVK